MPKFSVRRELCKEGLWDLSDGQEGTLADMLEHHISKHEGTPVSLDEVDLRYKSESGSPGRVTIVYKFRSEQK